MSGASPPLNRKFPNKESAVEDGMPLLCSIFFGFSGLYFAAVCIVKEDDLGIRSFSKIPFFGDVLGDALDFHVKYAIMALAVVCCACFYLCVMGALYAKMYNTDWFSEPTGIDQAKKDANKIAIDRARKKRDFFINLSIIGFNFGVFLLPLSLFVFLPDLAMSVTVILYLILVTPFFAFKTMKKE